MQTINFSLYIVVYNFIIGILVMIASEKLGVYAGFVSGRFREPVSRLTHTAALTFGSCVAVLSGSIYLLWHLLKVGL